jgi:putative serine protease PepD
MRNMNWVAALLVVAILAPAFRATAADAEEEAVTVYRKVSPAVVSLQNAEGSGTGVIIGSDGLILTNAHVVTSPLPFEARVDVPGPGGQSREAVFKKVELIGLHPKLDLALVKIDPAEHHVTLPAAQVARTKAQPG